MTIGGVGTLAASLLLVLVQASACARVKSEPRAQTAPPREEQPIPAVRPPVEQSQPKPAEHLPKVTEPPPTPTEQPKPAEPPQSKAVVPSPPKPPAPSPPKPSEPPRPSQSAPPKPATVPPVKTLDLDALEKRLRETKAIGIFTKLALKNQVDDLLGQFREFHRSHDQSMLARLRQTFDLLLLKVLSLLQDSDPVLASDIGSSRDALWNILNDPVTFKSP